MGNFFDIWGAPLCTVGTSRLAGCMVARTPNTAAIPQIFPEKTRFTVCRPMYYPIFEKAAAFDLDLEDSHVLDSRII